MYYLENPDKVLENGYQAFGAAMWFYMTPQNPKPSMHDVVTGFFEPNIKDSQVNILGNFGTTINIINGGAECGSWNAHPNALKRVEYYGKFLEHFGITDSDTNIDCAKEGSFPAGGAAQIKSYFEWDWHWGSEKRCMLVKWQTPYSAYVAGDYKRCVCDEVGDGAADCQDE